MNEVSNSLHAMGVAQYLLAFLFLASYALALSEFCGVRGRCYAVLAAFTAAIAFAGLTDPWIDGVMVVAFALVAMGLFSGTAWGLWALLDQRVVPAGALVDEAVEQPVAPVAERRPPITAQPARLPST